MSSNTLSKIQEYTEEAVEDKEAKQADDNVVKHIATISQSMNDLLEALVYSKRMMDALNGSLNHYYPFEMALEDLAASVSTWHSAMKLLNQGERPDDIDQMV